MSKSQKKILISGIPAGFPAPATEFGSDTIDLNELVVEHPAATCYVRVQGHSMKGAGIFTGDLLVVDRSKDPQHDSVVVAVVDGEFTVKRMKKKGDIMELVAENDSYHPIEIREGMQVEIWGVVTYVIHQI